MATFRLIIGGLVAYVDRRTQAGNHYETILLPYVPRPQLSREFELVLGHHPFLRFNTKHFHPDSLPTKPDFSIATFDASEREYIMFLKRGALSIRGSDSPGDYKLDLYHDDTVAGEKPGESLPPDKYLSQKRDIRWLPRMDDAFPGAGKIDSDCLSYDLKDLIAVRLDLFKGRLHCHKLGGEETINGVTDVHVYKFDEEGPAPEHCQALSEEIAFEMEIAGNVYIRVPQEEWELILRPDDKGDIECRLQNSEIESIIAPRDFFGARSAAPVLDFEFIYELAERRPPKKDWRHPYVVKKAHGGGGTAGDHICPGGRFTE